MKRLVFAAVLMLAVVGVSWAQECQGCKIDVSGYMGPNFRLIDRGEGLKNDMGFGMAFNRVTFSGMQDVGPIVKKMGWKVEMDFKEDFEYDLIYAYLQAYLNESVSFRFGHVKEAFSREWLHPTYNLLTVDRLITPELAAEGLNYTGYSYGLELNVQNEMFKLAAGAYDGQGNLSFVGNQDPALDYGLRAIFMATEGVEIGANLQMKTLPGVLDNDGDWGLALDDGAYQEEVGTEEAYQSNTAMAYGFDLDVQQNVGETMTLWAQAEFGMGDNYQQPEAVVDDEDAPIAWEDLEWNQFQYFYAKALLMVNKNIGVHLGYASFDPNTDVDDNSVTKIVPGLTYRWSDNTRTQAEVQLVSRDFGPDDNVDYTHFVLQQVLVW